MSQSGSNPPAGSHTPSGQSHKPGGAFGQMMNQAVTTGRPMFDKLSKTISSKLGNKPTVGASQQQSHPGQHTQQNQPHSYQQQGHTYSPQPQQQQWQQPQASNTYSPAQQPSPYQQSHYATPPSGYPGQHNYFPQQAPYHQNPQTSQAPQQPPNPTGYGSMQAGQSGNTGPYAHMQGQQVQYGQGQPHGQYQNQPLQGGLDGQQTGVVGGSQTPGPPQYVQSAPLRNTSPAVSTPPVPQSQYGYPVQRPLPQQSPQPTQSQYSYPSSGHEQTHPSAAPQQSPYPVSSAPPHPPAPVTLTPQEHQKQENWNPASQTSSHGQSVEHSRPSSVSPPPPLHVKSKPQSPVVACSQQPQPPTPGSQHPAPQPSMSEFIAELPADLGELSLMKTKPLGPHPSGQAPPYQAFQPSSGQSGTPSAGFAAARRAVSTNNIPFTDPWKFADPVTELPTREFYALADLLFETLDRKFEPRNTGVLEAPKVIGSWADLTEDASRLYTYNSYSALAKMWTLEGIPHFMVPCQPTLSPLWNYGRQSHAQELRLIAEAPSPAVTYPRYMPALNRAGWHKFFFLEMMHEPDSIDKLLQTHCSDAYQPGDPSYPDVNKRDRTESPALRERAEAIQTAAIMRVCTEIKTAMLIDPDVPTQRSASGQPAQGPLPPGSPQDVAARMHNN